MKRIAWTAAVLAACALPLLPAGCGKPAQPPPAAGKAAPLKGTGAAGSAVKEAAAPSPAGETKPTEPANSPNVVKAVGKAILKGFSSTSAEQPPPGPALQP